MKSMVRDIVRSHQRLWMNEFAIAWESQRFDQKLIWLMMVNHTIAVLTLVEFVVIRLLR